MSSPSQSRKHRGFRTQKVAAEYLADIFPYAESTGAGRPGRDILGTPNFAFEVKARRAFSPKEWAKQATEEAAKTGDYAAVIMRPDGMGEANIDQWPVFMTFAQFKALLREAGHGAE